MEPSFLERLMDHKLRIPVPLDLGASASLPVDRSLTDASCHKFSTVIRGAHSMDSRMPVSGNLNEAQNMGASALDFLQGIPGSMPETCRAGNSQNGTNVQIFGRSCRHLSAEPGRGPLRLCKRAYGPSGGLDPHLEMPARHDHDAVRVGFDFRSASREFSELGDVGANHPK